MIPGTTLDPIAFWAKTRPDRLAIRQGAEAWTYARLEIAVSRVMDAFLEEGFSSGEHVSIEFAPKHGLHFAVTLHALHRLGSLPVLIGARATEAERIALRSRALVDFALTTTPQRVEEPGTAMPLPARVPQYQRRLDQPAAICFTSGTEGAPRAVVLTHGNFLWASVASARNLGVSADDLWLACMPLHHVGGLSILTRSAAYGTGVLIHDTFDPDAVNAAIDREGVTLLSLVPPMLARILQARGERRFPKSLRAALIGGGPAPAELLKRAARLGLRALPTYGLTEAASQVATLSPRIWPDALDTCGAPLPYMRVEIRGADGRALPTGEEGEIAIRGPMVTEGYLGSEADDHPLTRGWLATGDFGRLDAAGRLIVLDRRVDRLVVGGENVSPLEVERALAEHPLVAEACVVGLRAEEWGHEVAAAVTLRSEALPTLEDVREFLGQRLSSFKIPRRLAVLNALPRNASGKLLRSDVVAWFRREMAKEDRA